MAVPGLRSLGVLVLALDKAWNLKCAEVGGRGPGEFPGGGTREWRRQEQRAQSETSQHGAGAVCGVPRKLQEQQSPSEYQGGPGSAGSCVLQKGHSDSTESGADW